MRLPERAPQHITETKSFKIFSNAIPDHWVIREVTERDYGIDCYVELVTSQNQLSGHLVSFQLKGLSEVKWRKTEIDTFHLSGLKISTVNYWYRFSVPVFLCLVDISQESIFYIPVKQYLRSHYREFAGQEQFGFTFNKKDQMDAANGLNSLLKAHFRDLNAEAVERSIIAFLAHYEQYRDFVEGNMDRDCFMGVELPRAILVQHMYQTMQFISQYLDLPWELEPMEFYKDKSRKAFGDVYDLYEAQMDEIVRALQPKLCILLLALKHVICGDEEDYWIHKNRDLYNLMINVHADGHTPWF